MTEAATLRLLGVVDPVGHGVGFVLPVFEAVGANRPRVQRVVDGRIVEFVGLDPPDAEIISEPASSIESSVGDEPLWAFAFDKKDIIFGSGAIGREALKSRLGDPVLQSRPMLALEVAEFLELQEARYWAAVKVYRNLGLHSVVQANRWRDLAVLTPDVRRELLEDEDTSPAELKSRVVVSEDNDVVTFKGVSKEIPLADRVRLEAVTKNIMSRFSELFLSRSPVKFRYVYSKAPKVGEFENQSHDEVAAIYVDLVDGNRICELIQRGTIPNVLAFSRGDGENFLRTCQKLELPAFVLFEDGTASRGDIVRFSNATPLCGLERRSRALEGGSLGFQDATLFSGGTITVPTGAFTNAGAAAAEARQAVLAAVGTGRRQRAQHRLFLRARGIGLDAMADAWATLYGRCIRMGARPERGIRFRVCRGAVDSARAEAAEWVARELFGSRIQVEENRPDIFGQSANIDAAVLLDCPRIKSVDIRSREFSQSYMDICVRILERQGWVCGRNYSGNALVRASGEAGEFELSEPWSFGARVDLARKEQFRHSLDHVRRLVLSEEASPSDIVSQFSVDGSLLVNVRDLIQFPANSESIYGLIGSQIRRFASGVQNSARSIYYAILLMDAIVRGEMYTEDPDLLNDIVSGPSIGREIHIICSSVRYEGRDAVAHMKIVAGSRNQNLKSGDRLAADFNMVISQDGISLWSKERYAERVAS